MPTYKFSNFPNAAVAFGSHFQGTQSEKLQEAMKMLKKCTTNSANGLQYGTKYFSKLGTSARLAGNIASVVAVLVILVGEIDMLYKKLKQLEERIFNTILDGKIEALKRNLRNLEDHRTPEFQKVAEIVSAISNLDEVLPVFTSQGSVFREQHYIGAPLFINFCGILNAICLIAEQTDAYNASSLLTLNQGYQEMLDWYRIKCIGRRLASCYVKGMLVNPLNLPSTDWTHDWDRNYDNNRMYYDENPVFPWAMYADDLGGKGWRLWCGWTTYCNLIDTWDTRPHEGLKFEKFEIQNTSDKLVGGGVTRFREIEYHRDVLLEYRRRVKNVMESFFDDASLIY